jgi:hypothetical protein
MSPILAYRSLLSFLIAAITAIAAAAQAPTAHQRPANIIFKASGSR